jgi:hypothetical protein
VRTEIECEGRRVVMQWQVGTYWDRSVTPTLRNRFGVGQLKV